MEIKFVKTHPDAKLPKRNLESQNGTGDSGFDLYSAENIVIPKKTTQKVNIGLQLAYITPKFWFRIESRSGLFFKHGIKSFEGIIDNPFRGCVSVSLTNNSDQDYEVKVGDRIAQFVVYELHEPEVSWADSVEETERGVNGFGSSGR